jgi:bacterial/archaeal transporter family-2 protein
MDRGLAVILTAIAGALIALQPPVNAGLAKATGSLSASMISFAIGTLILAALVGISGQAGNVGSAVDVRWYYLIGGFLGVCYVTTVLITVTSIGAGGVAAATISGQLTAGVLIDRLGILGLDETPITTERVIGIALLLVGTYLVVR